MNKQLPPLIIKIDIEQKASLERKLIMVNLSTSIELKILQLLNKIKRKWGKKKYNSFKQYSNKWGSKIVAASNATPRLMFYSKAKSSQYKMNFMIFKQKASKVETEICFVAIR